MKIEHIALRVNDIQKMSAFYKRYFGAEATPLYVNESRNFTSCFLHFSIGVQAGTYALAPSRNHVGHPC